MVKKKQQSDDQRINLLINAVDVLTNRVADLEEKERRNRVSIDRLKQVLYDQIPTKKLYTQGVNFYGKSMKLIDFLIYL